MAWGPQSSSLGWVASSSQKQVARIGYGRRARQPNLFGGSATGNGGDGIHIERNGHGTSAFGFTVEQNYGYGINLVGIGSDGLVRHCRFMSIWDELNGHADGSGHGWSIRFGENALGNVVDYVRYSSGRPVHEGAWAGNIVWGFDTASGSPDYAPYYAFRTMDDPHGA